MNVYEKLQLARVQLQCKELKKSGKNKFANYNYFELPDFLPEINSIFSELKLFSQFSYFSDRAELYIINAEKPDDRILFSSINAPSELKGALPIQSLGAMHTYLRRYLYMMALEIVEHELFDAISDDRKVLNNKLANDAKKINEYVAKEDKEYLDSEEGKNAIKDWTLSIDEINNKDDLRAKYKDADKIDNETLKKYVRNLMEIRAKKIGG